MLTARHNIGFISTRFAGTDGVSLETEKWVDVLERLGHACFYFSGQSDRKADVSRVVPEAFFRHEAIDAISDAAFNTEWGVPELLPYSNPSIASIFAASFSERIRPPSVTRRIHELADHLKTELYAFVRDFEIDLVVIENALTIPMNIPLGVAITEFIAETGFPTIAHHHDFYWERQRFLVNCVQDYLAMAFPPNLPSIQHVVINSLACQQLSLRTGISASLIPNVMDFETEPPAVDAYAADVRAALKLRPEEIFFLQPTRVVQRKGIEHALELIKRLHLDARLVISHASGDEGDTYEQRVRQFANLLAVPVNFVADIIREQRGLTADGRKIFTLADVYPHADFVTYPSTLEGFGNAFLEAVYFRKPVVVNNYSIFDVDIKPRGFHVVEFDGYVTDATVQHVRQLLQDPAMAKDLTDRNYALAKRYYSYSVLERHLETLMAGIFGEDNDL